MKLWILKMIGGPVGIVVRPIIAAVIGVLVGLGYQQAEAAIASVVWLSTFLHLVIAALPADILAMLSPKAVGAACAVAIWAATSDWVISALKGGIKQIQTDYNDAPTTGTIKADGLAFKNGQTVQAIGGIVDRVAYEKVYPEERNNRPQRGEPEIRRPIP